MTTSVAPRELIREAVSTLEDAYSRIFGVRPGDSPVLASDEHRPDAGGKDLPICAGLTGAGSRAASSAIQLCMVAALALLRIVRLLLEAPLVLSFNERAQLWGELVASTKVAGQSAYRAGLVLADPHSGNNPAPGEMCTASSTQMSHAQKRRSRLLWHWNRIRAENIRASDFIEFLRPLVDLDGIVVSYAYRDEDQDAKPSDSLGSGSAGTASAEPIDRMDDSQESPADPDLANPRVRP